MFLQRINCRHSEFQNFFEVYNLCGKKVKKEKFS